MLDPVSLARDVLEATALMAADPTLLAEAGRRVTEKRAAPARAVWDAAEVVRAQLLALGGFLAERARDVADVRDRVVAELDGRPAPGVPQVTEPSVLAAADLAPADTAISTRGRSRQARRRLRPRPG